jgi:ATP-dependent Lon protease
MLEPEWLKAIDLHLHIPRGGVSRDGADLGIPMFASVASLLLDIPTRSEVAASGEMTLRGAVLPVEGIKDKVLAAHRAGIREIVLPAKNARDMEEVPAEIREDVVIRYVSHADEVLEWMLERPPNRNPRTLVRPSEPPSGEMHP